MVKAYWQIGKMIVEKQGGVDRAKYGDGLIRELSIQLTNDFGKGFTITNLIYMRQFYLTFPIYHSVSDKLSWTHYRRLIGVKSDEARKFYMNEAIKANWSVRQLTREINTFADSATFGQFANNEFSDTVYAHKTQKRLFFNDAKTTLSFAETETVPEYIKSQTTQDVLQSLNQSTSAARYFLIRHWKYIIQLTV